MDRAEVAFLFAPGGMNGAEDSPFKIADTEYARGTNVELLDELPTTRRGVIVRDLLASAENITHIRESNFQGAKFFNPAKGQGGIIFAKNLALILVAIGGRKYAAHFDGRGLASTVSFDDISAGLHHDPALHQVWWNAWENIAVMQDGQGRAFIWDYPNAGRSSEGYRTDATHKSGSEIPNGGTVMSYAHARGIVVLNSRAILVGDQLHKSNLTDSTDLIRFTEQVYNVTSLYFLPPSAMGNITAAEILPTRNTVHGHGDVMFHCEDGIFSLDINHVPRSDWPTIPMVRHAVLKTGATGAYAVVLFDADQIFRSLQGIQSLRSAAANDNPEDNPQAALSERVRPFFQNDYPRWLRFASLASWTTAKRLLCTVYPVVSGRYRWNRGLAVRNFRPSKNQPLPACWEGLWTLPREAAGIVQLVDGIFDGEERMLAFCRSADGINRLVEFTDWLPYDVLPDGSTRLISCQVVTRGITAERALNQKTFRAGTIFWKNVRTNLTWGVWFRSDAAAGWVFWKGGKANMPALDDPLAERNPGAFSVNLGELPVDKCGAQIRWLQFLVRWEGYATFETIRIKAGEKDVDEDKFDASAFTRTFKEVRSTNYDDFEYSNGSDWLDNLTTK